MSGRYLAARVAGDAVVLDTRPGSDRPALAIAHTPLGDSIAAQVARALNLVEHAGDLAALDAAGEALRRVLVDHQRATDSSCSCGKGRVGDSFAEHVVVEWRDLLRATA